MTRENSTPTLGDQAREDTPANTNVKNLTMENTSMKTDATNDRKRNRLSATQIKALEQKMIALINKGHPLEASSLMLKIDIKQGRKIFADISQRGEVTIRVPNYNVVSSKKRIGELFPNSDENIYIKVVHQTDGSLVISPYIMD